MRGRWHIHWSLGSVGQVNPSGGAERTTTKWQKKWDAPFQTTLDLRFKDSRMGEVQNGNYQFIWITDAAEITVASPPKSSQEFGLHRDLISIPLACCPDSAGWQRLLRCAKNLVPSHSFLPFPTWQSVFLPGKDARTPPLDEHFPAPPVTPEMECV
jgi:hypothetical protein